MRPQAPRQPRAAQCRIAPAEYRTPESAQCERNRRYRPAREDLFEAGAEWRDLAIAGQAAFGKEADQFAIRQRAIDLCKRAIEQCRVFLASRDRDRLCRAENETQARDVEDLVIHHEAHRPAHDTADDQRVHVADMVADQQRGAFIGNPLESLGLDPV